MGNATARKVYTVGHSNRSLKEFLNVLKYYEVAVVIDVRRFPTSRKFPHFRREVLQTELPKHAIGYVWLGKELGGYREGGYLKYMNTEEFSQGFNKLTRIIELVKRGYVAIMCMEKFWFRCHRRFIANALAGHGYEVIHIIDTGKEVKHKLRKYRIK